MCVFCQWKAYINNSNNNKQFYNHCNNDMYKIIYFNYNTDEMKNCT